MSAPHPDIFQNTAADVPNEKGGASADATARIQDNAMLNVVDKAPARNAGQHNVMSKTRHAALWVQEQVRSAQSGPTMVQAELSPEVAAALLELNDGNRKVSDKFVSDYARDMTNGSWKFNGEAVIVARSGELNDGQHRCFAVIEAGVTIPMVFVFGVERESRDTLDQGRTRSVGDYLTMDGFTEANNLAAAASALWQYENVGVISLNPKFRPTKSEVKNCVERHLGLVNSVKAVRIKGATTVASISLLAFTHYVLSNTAGEMRTVQFIQSLVDGVGLSRGDPILNVRNRLMAEKRSLKNGEKVELIFKAWNAHARGEKRTLFRVNGVLPRLER